jgi:hypothetical protein
MKSKFRLWLAVSLVVVALGMVSSVSSLSPSFAEDEDDDDPVHELMEKTHEGKRSPWKAVQRAVASEPVDWASVNTAVPRFAAMSKALSVAKNKDVRDSADGYIDAVKDITAQAKKKDAKGIRAAVASLAKTCADCHYKGGPGGKLED